MTPDEERELVDDYLKYLEYGRLPEHLPETKEELKRLLHELDLRQATNPNFEAWEELDGLTHDDPEVAWRLTLDILARCHERDFGGLGAGPLEDLIGHHWSAFADRFEEKILTDSRFRDAFAYVRMGGVPLTVQRRLNDALVRTGIDPRSIIEFDEEIPDNYDGS